MKRRLLINLMHEYTRLLEVEQALYDHKDMDPSTYNKRYQISQTELKNLGIMIRKKMVALEDDLMDDRVQHILKEIGNNDDREEVDRYGFIK